MGFRAWGSRLEGLAFSCLLWDLGLRVAVRELVALMWVYGR